MVELYILISILEEECEIKVSSEEIASLFKRMPHRRCFDRRGATDVCVRDVVSLTEICIQRRGYGGCDDVFAKVRTHLADLMSLEENKITIDSYFIQDLGMAPLPPPWTWRDTLFLFTSHAILLSGFVLLGTQIRLVDLIYLEALFAATMIAVWIIAEAVISLIALVRTALRVAIGTIQRALSR